MTNELTTIHNDTSIIELPQLQQFNFTPDGLVMQNDIAKPEAEAFNAAGIELVTFAAKLGRGTRATQFAIGDWLNLGFQFYGDDFTQAADDISEILKCEIKTLQTYLFVARAIPIELRRTELDFSHFKEIAYGIKDQDDREYWIDKAVNDEMSVSDLRDAIKEAKGTDDTPKIVFVICPKCNKKFDLEKAEKCK